MEELRLYLESNELDLSGLDYKLLKRLNELTEYEIQKYDDNTVKMWAIQNSIMVIKYFRYEDKELALETFRNIITKCVDNGDEYINYTFGETYVPLHDVDYFLNI